MDPVNAHRRALGALLLGLALGAARPAAAADRPQVQSLTIRETVARAVAHNLDVRIERINPRIADWGIVGEQAAFEPVLGGSFAYRDSAEQLDPERAAALGFNSIQSETWRFRSGIDGRLPTGLRYDISAFDTRSAGTLAPDTIHTGQAAVTLTQPVLRNFWLGPNTTALRVARQTKALAEAVFVRQLIDNISQAQAAYYDLVFAIEDHRARLEDRERARALLAENQRRLEVGVLAPLDVIQAEAGVAEREEAVLIAERTIKDRENALKRLITQDVTELRGVTLVPVDAPPVREIALDLPRSINTAFAMRPDYLAAQTELDRRGILVAYNRNQLWPQVDLQGSYGLNGRGGSFGEFADNTASGNSPAWSVGVVVTIPLGNRRARADYHAARLEEEKALLRLKRLEQDIIVEVDNAVGQIETNRQRLTATAAALRLAEESLRAEQEKLRTGASTSFLVLQAQAQLASVRAAAIRARADYNQSLVELARVEGTTLVEHGIEVAGLD